MTKSIEQQNHDYCLETVQLKHSLELHFLEMGKRLMEIRDNKLYKPYWDDFIDYLMEAKIEKSRANRIINIYDKFVLQYKIEPKKLAAAGGWSVLSEVLPVVTDQESAEEWVSKASEHPQHELRAEIREARGLVVVGGKDKLSDIKGEFKFIREEGMWKAWHTRPTGLDDPTHSVEEYGPTDTLDDLIQLIKDGVEPS